MLRMSIGNPLIPLPIRWLSLFIAAGKILIKYLQLNFVGQRDTFVLDSVPIVDIMKLICYFC